jgi:hypothetical protein
MLFSNEFKLVNKKESIDVVGSHAKI